VEAEEIARLLTEAMGHLVRAEELAVEQGDEALAEHVGQLALELDNLLENR
jgi:hypothetical protein